MSRKLKTITLAAALTASLAGLAAAAGPEGRRGRMGGPERIQARVERMRQDLDLTEDQARRIEDILMDAAQNRSQGFGREDEGDRGHLREQRRETFERIQSVLTAEQRQRMAELREERRSRRGTRGNRDRDRDRQDDDRPYRQEF